MGVAIFPGGVKKPPFQRNAEAHRDKPGGSPVELMRGARKYCHTRTEPERLAERLALFCGAALGCIIPVRYAIVPGAWPMPAITPMQTAMTRAVCGSKRTAAGVSRFDWNFTDNE